MFWEETTITNNRHFPSFAFGKVNIFFLCKWICRRHNPLWMMRAGLTMPRMHGLSGWSVVYFRLQNLLHIHGMKRQSGNLKARSGDLRRPRLYVPSSGGNGIDILNIYEDHNLPLAVTCDLALSHESRLAAHHSRLTIRDSRLSMLCDSGSAD